MANGMLASGWNTKEAEVWILLYKALVNLPVE